MTEVRVGPVGWQQLPGTFEASSDATTARAQRRLEYVLRQLEWRIMEADGLWAKVDETQAQLDILRQQVAVRSREAEAWRNEYEATMATKTMRAARIPRELYARIRGRS
jgi:hypothetical protein